MSLTLSPGMSRDSGDLESLRGRVKFVALIVAASVITALTAAAFWLSYAHLAGIAGEHGLGHSPARQWAWPATLDLFIIAGEVLMFVAALKGKRDNWAIGLTVAGSLGSIGLNIAGVGSHAEKLDYIVAAVPPSAALLAFGALMRQVHHFIVSLSPEDTAPSRDEGQSDVPGDMSPVRDTTSAPVPAPVSPESVVPAPSVPALSRPAVAVPATVSPARPVVRARVDEPVPARDSTGDTGTAPGVRVPGAKADVPEEALGNLSAIVRFLTGTGHTRDEIKDIVPTLPGKKDVNPDSLKKAIQRYGPQD